jgi:hypothetical protein
MKSATVSQSIRNTPFFGLPIRAKKIRRHSPEKEGFLSRFTCYVYRRPRKLPKSLRRARQKSPPGAPHISAKTRNGFDMLNHVSRRDNRLNERGPTRLRGHPWEVQT